MLTNFKNIASHRAIGDLLFVWFGTLIGAFAGILAQVLIARMMSVSDFGVLSSALALVGLAVPLCVFGSTQYWLKAFGEEGWMARRWLHPSFSFLVMTSGSIVLVLALWAIFGVGESNSQFVILSLLPAVFSMIFIEVALTKYQLEQNYVRFSALASATSIARLLVVLIILAVAVEDNALRLTAFGYMVVSLLITAFLLPQIRRLWYGQINLKGHREDLGERPQKSASISTLLTHSWVFGVAGFLYLAWAQGHVVIAKYALSSFDAGIYSAALVVLNAVCLMPMVAFSKFMLPKVHRWAAQDFEKLKRFSRYANILMLGVGSVTAVIIFWYAELAISIAFGPGYESAASVLQVLVLTIPMRFLGYNAGMMLRTKRFMLVKIAILIIAVIFNLGLVFLFMPIWGVYGLAATVVVTEFLLVMAYVYFVEICYFRQSSGRQ